MTTPADVAAASLFIVKGHLQFCVPYFVDVTLPVSPKSLTREEQRLFKKPSLRQFFLSRYKHYADTSYVDSSLKLGRVRIVAGAGAHAAGTANAMTADEILLDWSDKVVVSTHYHEPPVVVPTHSVPSLFPIQIVDFIPASKLFDETFRGGVIAVNKPQSVPAHASGKYHRNTVEFFLRLGLFAVARRQEVAERIVSGFGDDAARNAERDGGDIFQRAEQLLRQHVFGGSAAADGKKPPPLFPCHRLDKGTSGVFLIASSSIIARAVMELLVEKTATVAAHGSAKPATAPVAPSRIEKTYIARVRGKLEFPEQHLDENGCFLLLRDMYATGGSEFWCLSETEQRQRGGEQEQEQRHEQRQGAAAAAAGQSQHQNDSRSSAETKKLMWAATLFKTVRIIAVESSCGAESETIVQAKPVSGRTHQIRVHLASLGHPIVGDCLYEQKCGGGAGGAPKSASAAVDPKSVLVAGRDFPCDEVCPECRMLKTEEAAAAKIAEAFSFSCPTLCLHAAAYRFPESNLVVHAELPTWAKPLGA